ncbi:unnamed protein product, partial [Cladocopium goreaui]
MVARTRAIVQGKSRCSKGKNQGKNCFLPFRESSRFSLLIDHLRKLARMDKLEIDKEVDLARHPCMPEFLQATSAAGTLAEPMPEGTGASKRPRTVKKRDDKTMIATTQLIEKAQPPGSFYEYLAMLRRAHPTGTFSYKLFCSVWELNFGDFLKLRSDSAHVKCNICVRYKLMVRKLAKCTVARQMQLKLLDGHREQQYNDRFRERGQDLRATEVFVQGDNGPKEIKNNSVVRYLSMLTGQGKIKRAEFRTLMSGHTHEDVDSFFANLSAVIKHGGHRLHTPFDYVSVLDDYLQRDD